MNEMIFLYRYLLPILMLGWAIILYREAKRVRQSYFTAIIAIAFLYPLGKFFQFWLIGPTWIRWYMSDVGFISCVALTVVQTPFRFFGINAIERLKRGVGTGFRLAILAEALQLLTEPYVKNRPTFSAAGDWMDIVVFCVMYTVNRFLVSQLERKLPPPPHNQRRTRLRATAR